MRVNLKKMLKSNRNPGTNKKKSDVARELFSILDRYREDEGLTLSDFADKIGVDKKNLYNWRNGFSQPSDLYAIAAMMSIGKSKNEATAILNQLYKKHGETRKIGPRKKSSFQFWKKSYNIIAYPIIFFAFASFFIAILFNDYFVLYVGEPDHPPISLTGSNIRGECVPGGGTVEISFLEPSATKELTLPCPETAWLMTDLNASARAEIRSIRQKVGQNEYLNFDFVNEESSDDYLEGLFLAERSPTKLLWSRRQVMISRKCIDGSDKIILNTASRPQTIRCNDDPPIEVSIVKPEEASLLVEFKKDDTTIHTCMVTFVLAISQPVDLTQLEHCNSDKGNQTPSLQTSIPLRPFWKRIDTFKDSTSGNIWMRDLYRYGPSKGWGPSISKNEILRRVHLDTGDARWDFATQLEVSSVLDRTHFRGVTPFGSVPILTGIIRGKDNVCGDVGLARFAVYVDTDKPRAHPLINTHKCNITAGELGIWLIRRTNS